MLYWFSTIWCGPCRTMAPTVKKLQNDGLDVRKIDAQQESELAQEFNVTAVPTMVWLENDIEVRRHVGALSEAELRQFCEL